MDEVYIYFLLGNLLLCVPRIQCKLEATACFAGLGRCGQLILACDDKSTIKILSAQYGLRSKTNVACNNVMDTKEDCDKYKENCCVPAKSGPAPKNYSKEHWILLNSRCTGNHSCISEAVQAQIQQSFSQLFSDVVTVKYTCQNAGATEEESSPLTGDEEEPSGGSSTAAIVVPIIAVLVLACVAVALLIYWRRKKMLENSSRTEKGQGNGIPAPVHNAGYDYTEQNKDSSKSPDTEHTDDETVYHTIDPDSIPDKVVANDYLELDQADDYNVIGQNDADNKTVTNDYFILEPQGDITDKEEVDYNKINLKAHGIVKDPSYQRLAAVDPLPKVEANADNENYSDLGDKLTAEEKDGQMNTGDNKNDDYAHLNKDSI